MFWTMILIILVLDMHFVQENMEPLKSMLHNVHFPCILYAYHIYLKKCCNAH